MALAILLLFLVAWGALVFGAVYDWAYVPLLTGAVLVGLWGLVRTVPRTRATVNRALLAALAVVVVAICVPLIPLDRPVLVLLSPATDEFLRQFDLGFAVRVAADSPIVHPLSIHPERTRLGLAFVVGFGVLLLGLARGIGGRGLRAFAPGLAVLGVLLSLIGVVQKAMWNGKVYGFWEPINANVVPFGPFINRNHFAGWMLMAVPVVLGCFIAKALKDRGERDGEGRGEYTSRAVLLGFSVVVMTLALALTMSRSGIACLLLAMVISGFHVLRRQDATAKQRWLVIYVGAVFVAAIGWAGFDAIASRFAEMDLGLGGRAGAWADAWRIHGKFPVFGSGFNTYGTATLLLQQFQIDLFHFAEAHNDYLQILVEGGYVLAVPVAALILTFVWQVRARFRENRDDRTGYWLRLGAVTGVIAIGLQECVEFSLQIPGNAVLFAALCAIAVRPATPKGQGTSTAESDRTGRGRVSPARRQARTTPSPSVARILLLGAVLATAACGGEPEDHLPVNATYSKSTGKLESLTYDTNKDGRPDAWGQMDGSRLVRMDFDKNWDGVVDRWEYFTPAGTVEKVGTSRANDGKEDSWAYPAADGTTARIEVSARRDGRITRREYYERNQLTRTEEDTDADGRIDKWETFVEGTLASVELDTDRKGTPDRRLTYGPDGVKLQKLR